MTDATAEFDFAQALKDLEVQAMTLGSDPPRQEQVNVPSHQSFDIEGLSLDYLLEEFGQGMTAQQKNRLSMFIGDVGTQLLTSSAKNRLSMLFTEYGQQAEKSRLSMILDQYASDEPLSPSAKNRLSLLLDESSLLSGQGLREDSSFSNRPLENILDDVEQYLNDVPSVDEPHGEEVGGYVQEPSRPLGNILDDVEQYLNGATMTEVPPYDESFNAAVDVDEYLNDGSVNQPYDESFNAAEYLNDGSVNQPYDESFNSAVDIDEYLNDGSVNQPYLANATVPNEETHSYDPTVTEGSHSYDAAYDELEQYLNNAMTPGASQHVQENSFTRVAHPTNPTVSEAPQHVQKNSFTRVAQPYGASNGNEGDVSQWIEAVEKPVSPFSGFFGAVEQFLGVGERESYVEFFFDKPTNKSNTNTNKITKKYQLQRTLNFLAL